MGMDTYVIGFKPADEKWRAMKAVWDACKAAGIAPPVDVDRFFGGYTPAPHGVRIGQNDLLMCGAAREWSDESSSGFEVDVKKLPPDVTVVRFYNSW